MPTHSLEQEAMERVRRMYASHGHEQGRSQAREPSPEPPEEKKPEPPEAFARNHEHKEPAAQHGMLELLMKDKDKSLIMLLLVIMLRDGADMNLILALVYLLV